jgi:hypothetical protein
MRRLGVSLLSNDVVIWDMDHNEVSELLTMLMDQGLQANRDFEFEFRPGFLNYQRGLPHRKSVTFRFQDPAWATWFQLRYA